MPVTPEQIYEEVLVVRCQLGDDAAFRELFLMHEKRLTTFIRRLGPPGQEADLAQEIWVAIHRALPGLKDIGKFRPWSFRIARDFIFREFRRRRIAFQPLTEGDLEEPGPDDDAPLDQELVQQGLETLSPEHREVLHLRFFEDLTYEEIAGLVGSSVGTVRSRLHYAKRALKSALKGNNP